MWVQEAACKEHVVLGKQCGNLPAVLSSSGTLRGKKPIQGVARGSNSHFPGAAFRVAVASSTNSNVQHPKNI